MVQALFVVLFAVSSRAAEVPAPEFVTARAVGWDLGWKPKSKAEWIARAAAEVKDAAKAGVEVVVFPELFAWGLGPYAAKDEAQAPFVTRIVREELLPAVKAAAAKDMLVVLGSYPHQDPGAKHAFNRSPVLVDGKWAFVDKLDPTQGEEVEDPPIKPGYRLPLIRYKGALAAVLVCFSLEKPELAAALKKRGVRLILAPSATIDEEGVARVLRTASARAVELGAAVVVSPLLGEQDGWKNMGSAALYLPAQKGIVDPVRESPRRTGGFARDDFRIPWKALADLRVQPEGKPETRPFLAPTPFFQVELDGAAP